MKKMTFFLVDPLLKKSRTAAAAMPDYNILKIKKGYPNEKI